VYKGKKYQESKIQQIASNHEEKKTILKQQNILKAVPHRWNSKKKIIG